MTGIDALTGKPADGLHHLHQSVRDILNTPKGTRVMLREYGSNLFKLVDKPINESTRMEMIAEVFDALERWEPRIRVKKVSFNGRNSSGQLIFDIDARLVVNGQPIRLEGIVL